MALHDSTSRMLLTRLSAGTPRGRTIDAFDCVDRVLQDLANCEDSNQQMRLTLEGARDGLQADAVFSFSHESERIDVIGKSWVSAKVCQVIAGQLPSAISAPRQILLANVTPSLGIPGLPPGSLAAVRLSLRRSVWMVAVSFDAQRRFERPDVRLLGLFARLLKERRLRQRASVQLKDTLFGIIQCMASTIDAKDPYTCGHSERVARMAARLGREMNLAEAVISDLYLAGLLHDVGKIGIPDRILRNPGELTASEMNQVRLHPIIGERMIAPLNQLAFVCPGIRSHHEAFDGSGYPDRLRGHEIPLMARLLAVADSCDAMMSTRPYRSALPREQIDSIMANGSGRQWDPEVVRAFLSCRDELYAICQKGIGKSVLAAVERAASLAMPSEEADSTAS